MNREPENQRNLTNALRNQLQLLKNEERQLQHRINLIEAMLVVQELRDRITGKDEVLGQLRSKVGELEGKLISPRSAL